MITEKKLLDLLLGLIEKRALEGKPVEDLAKAYRALKLTTEENCGNCGKPWKDHPYSSAYQTHICNVPGLRLDENNQFRDKNTFKTPL